MSYFTTRIDTSQPNLVYYDLSIKNFVNDTQADSQQLTFFEQRSGPIITNCDDYEMSIIRFQVDSWVIPVFFCEIQKDQSNVNLSIYSFTLTYDDGTNLETNLGPYYIIWSPQNKTIQTPPAPNTSGSGFQFESDYYYAYDFRWLIQLVNEKLFEAYEDLKIAIPSDPVVQLSNAPFLAWNSDTNKATLYADSSLYNKDTFPQVKIYFNRAMQGLFNSFPFIIHDTDITNNKEYEVIIDSYYGQKIVEIGLASYIIVDQTVTCVNNWSPVASIVFTSAFLPMIANQYSNLQTYYNNKLIQLGPVANSFANVITDISLESDSGYQNTILYNPTAEYRMCDLHQNSNISAIDIAVWFRTKASGTLKPFILASGASCSLKLMFRKKLGRS
jgi:hypothetical protein